MPRKLDPQIKQHRTELRERKAQRRRLTNEWRAAEKSHRRLLGELDARISIITGRLGK